MQNHWLICWRGLEEVHRTFGEALDRQEQLDALRIETKLFQVMYGQRLLISR
jgi:hypothetical protein